jgi:hypothetical protein
MGVVESWQRSISVGEGAKRVTVTAPDERVIAWVRRYLSPWWAASPGAREARSVHAWSDPRLFAALAEVVASVRHRTVQYPRAETRVVRDGDVVVAVTPGDQMAFRYDPAAGRMEVVGERPAVLPLARAAARVARELVRAELAESSWLLLHASAVVLPGGRTVLTLGGRGAGKSTVAFTLASTGGSLLGNDRVFARATQSGGGVELLAWPSGAAVGLGLLGALGWDRVAGGRLAAGSAPHPSQDSRVTEALLSGRSGSLVVNGQELKAHIRPEEFGDWYGLDTASWAKADVVLFPEVVGGGVPAVRRDRKADIEEGNFMSGDTEDSYPDIFGLRGATQARSVLDRAELTEAVGRLSRYAVTLGHDVEANAAFLTDLITREPM